ncbi:argininosuccinate lyase [Tenacibaculum sp. 190524A02b]|uniref:Argininosuccinate lyase n=1 Tax=Tenacibaculum vairaonense TaxID=3137860 RepID=A0ABP1FCI3_9FLAO
MRKAIVFVESNTSGTGYILASIAYQKGYQPLVITNNLSRYNFGDFIEPHIINTNNYEEVKDKLASLFNSYDIDGITSTSDYYMEMVAKLAQEFNYPSPSLTTIKLCRNKHYFREHMRKNNLLTPSFKVIQNEKELNHFLNQPTINYPFVVKPVQGSGSIGVQLISERKELASHGLALLSKKINERGQKINSAILIEEFIAGEEFSLELFNGEVVGITRKYKGELPHFVEVGHDFPYEPNEEFLKKVTETIKNLKKSFDLSWGAFHIEFIKTSKELFIVEMNPRLAGGCIPILIKESLGVDLLELSLKNITGRLDEVNFIPKNYASIRFVIPENSGEIQEDIEKVTTDNYSSKIQIKSYGKNLSNYKRNFDFRDRIGHVIASNNNKQQAIDEVEQLCKKIQASLTYIEANNTGRISKGIHKGIRKVIFGEKVENEDVEELKYISLINKAHIIMLQEEGILNEAFTEKLMVEIKELENIGFSPLMNKNTPRGLYMLYEQYLIDKLGMEIAGSMHIGRSRNDMNATLARMQVKNYAIEIVKILLSFTNDLLSLSNKYKKTIMSSYTHYQPAVPITYGFYLQGVITSLIESIQGFLTVIDTVDVSPLGSCSVGGTSIPINQKTTASYLGFKYTVNNALYGVASRDFILSLLSQISIANVLISRIASDFMLWNTQEFNFFKLSDTVVGSSSIMPNKRNPFVLENIQGKSGVIAASFIGAVTAMQKTPFTNSISVGTESKMLLKKTKNEFIDSINLLQIFINHAIPNEEVMKSKAIASHTMATEYANKLVLEHNIPFRQAHFIVGKAVAEAIEKNTTLEATTTLASYELASSIQEVVDSTKFGGGASEIKILENGRYLTGILQDCQSKLHTHISQMEGAFKRMEDKTNSITEKKYV